MHPEKLIEFIFSKKKHITLIYWFEKNTIIKHEILFIILNKATPGDVPLPFLQKKVKEH